MKKGFRKTAALVLMVCLLCSLGMPAYGATFSDVPEGSGAYQVVEEMSSKGVFVGYTDGTFHPDATITNAEFTAIIARAYCLANGLTLSDSNPGTNWYDGVFAFAVSHNIITSGQFAGRENSAISRSDATLLAANALQSSGDSTAANTIVSGDSGSLGSSGNTTRAEAAAIVSRFLAYSSGSSSPAEVPGGKILIAAAASLQNAFEKSLIPEFMARYPVIEVTGTFDSSGRLQTQIEAGLEADLFFSAATTQMNNLRDQGLIDEATVVNLLENKIVLIGTKGVKTDITGFESVTDAALIAIGDPESVPAGQYAREVFTNLGIWDEVLAKSSLGTNVTEVLTWVAAGSVEIGVVYATDAASNENVEIIAEAPAGSLQTPVLYPVALTADSQNKAQAQAFLDFLKGDTAKAIFESYGFFVVR